jgi:two-component system response regulator (stage 0 sporulation protein F)
MEERDTPMRPQTILIIEDHTSVRLLLARVLEEAGYQVFEAANGRQGLDQFRAQPVDLVITDLEMPEMTGLEVILELTRAFLDVKVIAMSGRSVDDLSKATLLGARQTLTKPFDLPTLLHAVEYELRH